MLISKWRPRLHRFFGPIYVPTIELEIRNSAGDFCPYSLCLDSGAVVSLLPRSAADALGITLQDGRPIHLSGVGSPHTNAYVHDLAIKLTGLAEIILPFAIAVHDSVPGLLGRLGVFDRYE